MMPGDVSDAARLNYNSKGSTRTVRRSTREKTSQHVIRRAWQQSNQSICASSITRRLQLTATKDAQLLVLLAPQQQQQPAAVAMPPLSSQSSAAPTRIWSTQRIKLPRGRIYDASHYDDLVLRPWRKQTFWHYESCYIVIAPGRLVGISFKHYTRRRLNLILNLFLTCFVYWILA